LLLKNPHFLDNSSRDCHSINDIKYRRFQIFTTFLLIYFSIEKFLHGYCYQISRSNMNGEKLKSQNLKRIPLRNEKRSCYWNSSFFRLTSQSYANRNSEKFFRVGYIKRIKIIIFNFSSKKLKLLKIFQLQY
jgi:hypothetical protein